NDTEDVGEREHEQHDHDHSHEGHNHAHESHGKSSEDDLARAGLHGHDHGPSDGPWWKSRKALLTLASGGALAIAWILGGLVPSLDAYAFTIAMLVGLVPIAWRAAMGV